MAKRKDNRVYLGWGEGGTDLFLNPTEFGSFELLDYEYDTKKIHSIGGGRVTYESNSGLTGIGFLNRLGTLIPVGYWRVDTVYLEQYPLCVDEENDLKVMIPYQKHEEDKKETLQKHPVVILWGKEKIVYCKFEQLTNILKKILLGEFSEEGGKILTKKLLRSTPYTQKTPEEVKLQFYNLWGWTRPYPWPWEFADELLKNYRLETRYGRGTIGVVNVLRIARDANGDLIRYSCISGERYAEEILPEEVLLKGETPIKGWELGKPYTLYRVRNYDVHIVVWAPLKEELPRIIESFARRYPEGEAELIRGLLEKKEIDNLYEEYELSVKKLLFFGDEEKWFDEARKGLIRKLRKSITYDIRSVLEDRNNQKILEEIPDELVISIQDSLDSGNCRPGTESFRDRYFPGKTETTAGELKKFASNNKDVMRVLVYMYHKKVA